MEVTNASSDVFVAKLRNDEVLSLPLVEALLGSGQ